MVWHLITYAKMLIWLPMYMIIKLEVQKKGNYFMYSVHASIVWLINLAMILSNQCPNVVDDV